jgi:hypothetical protein
MTSRKKHVREANRRVERDLAELERRHEKERAESRADERRPHLDPDDPPGDRPGDGGERRATDRPDAT